MKSRPYALTLLLLWLIGVAMRLTILAVPPVIPALRDEFNLSGTDIGILTGLPVILFAAAALAGSRLVSRVGVVSAAVIGLILTALGSALRGVSPDVLTLFAATVVTGVGVAMMQPAAPALVGRWLPNKIGLGTGVYTNGLIVGEILPVALFPLLFPLLGESWRATFVLVGDTDRCHREFSCRCGPARARPQGVCRAALVAGSADARRSALGIHFRQR